MGIAFCFVMVFLTVRHGIGRYVFGEPLSGNVELSCFMLVILIFFVGAYTQVAKGHISIGIIVNRLSGRTRAVVDSFIHILCLIFTVLAAWQTVVQGINMIKTNYVSTILKIPHPPFVFVVAFGWGIFGLAIAMHLVHSLRRAVRGVK